MGRIWGFVGEAANTGSTGRGSSMDREDRSIRAVATFGDGADLPEPAGTGWIKSAETRVVSRDSNSERKC